MSMAAIAVIVTDERPKYSVRRCIFCHSRSVSSGFSPIRISRSPQAMLWLNGASMIALTTSGCESASPMPSKPVVGAHAHEHRVLAAGGLVLHLRNAQQLADDFGDFHRCVVFRNAEPTNGARIISLAVRRLKHGRSSQDAIDQPVCLLAHFVGKVVFAIGVLDAQTIRMTVELVNLARGGGDPIDAGRLKVAVFCRRDDQDMTRGQGGDHFVKVERDLGQAAAIVGEPRHVAGLAPSFFGEPDFLVAAVIVEE